MIFNDFKAKYDEIYSVRNQKRIFFQKEFCGIVEIPMERHTFSLQM